MIHIEGVTGVGVGRGVGVGSGVGGIIVVVVVVGGSVGDGDGFGFGGGQLLGIETARAMAKKLSLMRFILLSQLRCAVCMITLHLG